MAHVSYLGIKMSRNLVERKSYKLEILEKKLRENVKNLALTGSFDYDFLFGCSTARSNGFDFFDNVHTFFDTAKDAVLAIKPWGWDRADEKLRSVGVGSTVCHRKYSGSVVFVTMVQVFVTECLTID